MPRPSNPQELIYTPSKSVPYPNWVEDVGDRAVFRISGLYEYRVLAGRNDSGRGGFANEARLEQAKETFAKIGWDAYCTVPRNPLAPSGIAGYLKAKQGKRTRLSLYGSFITILMLEHHLKDNGIDGDIYEGGIRDALPTGVKIVPYIFDVPEATPDKTDAILAKAAAIKLKAGQRSTAFVHHMCACNEMFSEKTARAVQDECKMSDIDIVLGERSGGGTKGNQVKKACSLDRVVYPLT